MVEETKVTTSVKFKLKLDKETSEKLNNYFDEYGKAINFAVRIVDKELSKVRFAGKIKKDSNGEITKDEKGKNVYEYPDESCSCGKQIKYWENEKPICEECFKLKFTENGLRKRMYSAKGRKAEQDFNVKNSTNKISKTHFSYAIREAFILNKSVEKQKKARRKRLENERRRLQQFIDMLDGKVILLPKRERQRSERYIHPSWQKSDDLSNFRGYSKNNILNLDGVHILLMCTKVHRSIWIFNPKINNTKRAVIFPLVNYISPSTDFYSNLVTYK